MALWTWYVVSRCDRSRCGLILLKGLFFSFYIVLFSLFSLFLVCEAQKGVEEVLVGYECQCIDSMYSYTLGFPNFVVLSSSLCQLNATRSYVCID